MANIIEKENSSLLSSQKQQQQKDDLSKSIINKDEMNYLKLIE
uniref:Uncharacterized protein n=1 Tax=Panagrolaimus sp. PS1159 TaxID=55785 RepID=A0AC35G218_9BILA